VYIVDSYYVTNVVITVEESHLTLSLFLLILFGHLFEISKIITA